MDILPDSIDGPAEAALIDDFALALERQELFLVYQPVIDLKRRRPNGFEALMRWQHPDYGLIPPASFIPIAEESGLIIEASRWALRQSCDALQRIQAVTGYDNRLFMSVNFSTHDFAEENFLDQIYIILSETDVKPQQICLELSQSLLASQPDAARATLGLCHRAGLNLCVDDLDIHQADPATLKDVGINTVKIDRPYVQALSHDAALHAIIEKLIVSAAQHDLHIIAQGVETAREAALLKDMGCHMAQGYYFARPGDDRAGVNLVRNWNPDQFAVMALP